MKIVINTKTVVPVEIGKLKFEIDFNDEGLQRILDNHSDLVARLNNNDATTLQEAREGLGFIIDFYLGEGAFDKIYAEYPSTMTIVEITEQLMLNVAEELESRRANVGNSERAKAYLKKNNK